jgi:hypothetical protein
MPAQSTTRAAIESAADTLTYSRSNGTRQGACPFLNSHRDGICAKCQDMARHDAELAAAKAAPAVEVEAPVLSKVDQRAFTILTAGKVHLTFGQKYALVDGSRGQTYRTSKESCECPAFTRYPGPCKHMRACAALCGLIRIARAEAKATGRTRLPALVGLALRPVARVEAPASAPDHVSDALGYCDRCGRDLSGGSRCPRGQHLDRSAVLDQIVAGVAA